MLESTLDRSETSALLAAIESSAAARVSTIKDALRSNQRLRDALLGSEDAAERCFSALALGSVTHLDGSAERLWTSWIENNPPYLWLSTSETVLVDLAAIASEDAFLAKYGCSPRQMAQLLRHRPESPIGPLFVNLIADDLDTYLDQRGRETIGPIIAVASEHPERFYRLKAVREAAFEILDVDWNACLEDGASAMEGFAQPTAESAHRVAGLLHLASRNGGWPPPGQIANRIAYYRAGEQLANKGRVRFVDDVEMPKWFGKGIRVADAGNPRQLALRLSRLYLQHHLVTAPLTGALGGDYAMLSREVDQAGFIHFGTAAFPAAQEAGKRGRVGLGQWIFDLQRRGGRRLRVGGPALRREVTNEEWASFLSWEKDDRRAIMRSGTTSLADAEAAVASAAKRAGIGLRHFEPEREMDLWREAAAYASRGGLNWPMVIGGALAVSGTVGAAGVAFAVGGTVAAATTSVAVGANLGRFLSFIGGCAKVARGVDPLQPGFEKTEERLSTMCPKRFDRVRVDRFRGVFKRPGSK